MWKVLLKKWKGLSIKQKAVIIGIATLIAFFPVIFIVILTSPTSGRQITIGSDRNICTGCFDGSSWWLIDENRCRLPKDHWAFSLHRQLLEGKFQDIEL